MDYIAKGIEDCLEGKREKLRYPLLFIAGNIDYIIGTADEMMTHKAALNGYQKDPRATEKDYSLYDWGGTTATVGESLAFMIACRSGLKREAYILLADYLARAVNYRRTWQDVGLIGTARSIAYKVRDKLRKQEDLEEAVDCPLELSEE